MGVEMELRGLILELVLIAFTRCLVPLFVGGDSLVQVQKCFFYMDSSHLDD